MPLTDERGRRPGHADEVVLLFERDGAPTAVRGRIEQTFGYRPDEVLARRFEDLVHPSDRGRFLTLWAAVVANPGITHRVELRLQVAGGDFSRVEVEGTDRCDDDDVLAVVLHIRDVTGRQIAGRSFEATEANVRALLSNSRDAYVIVDHHGRLSWASEQIGELFGYPIEQAIGVNVFDVLHPDDAAEAVSRFVDLVAGRAEADPMAVRVWAGERGWVRVESVGSRLVDDDGGLDGVLVNLRDLSWRQHVEVAVRQSEERFRALVQNSGDAVIVVDAAGIVTYASPGMERLFGWLPAEVEGGPCLSLIAPQDQASMRAALADLAARGPDEPVTGLFRLRRPDTGWRWAEVIAVNHLANPAVGGIVANVRDVSERLEADEALRASEARFRTVVSGSFDVTAVLDPEAVIRWVTPNCERLLGYRPDEIVGLNGLDLIHPDDLPAMAGQLAEFAAGEGVPNPRPIRMVQKDGSWRNVEIVGNDFLQHPEIAGIAVNLRDIGDRVAGEQERRRLTEVIEMTSDLVSISASDGSVVYLNEAARKFVGIGVDVPLDGFDLSETFSRTGLDNMPVEVVATMEADGSWTGEFELVRHDQVVVPVQAQVLAHRDGRGRIEFVSSILRDISERKEFERRLRHEATHDPLTGLPNRTLLLDRLEGALSRSRAQGTAVAVLFCDLDNFKVVNDSLGHSYGDRVLTEVARRLQEQLRPGDTVSRFGGDEFVILCERCEDVEGAIHIARRVDEAMVRPFELDGSEVYVGVSVGIAMATPPDDGDDEADRAEADPEALIRDADAAMYRAKERGRGRYQVFEHGIWARAVDRFDLENALRGAVSRRELDVLYQPVVALDAPSGDPDRIVGVEALVRWDHPQRGRLLPGEFIHLAEDTGLVLSLGSWVLDTACRQMAAWLTALPDLGPFTLAVNLSGRQLEYPELVDVVARAIAASGIPAERLDLEVTESVLMKDVELSAATLATLKDLGVNISVDDFGTGYSSLAYLRRFPVDRLKVDRSFVAGLGHESEDSAITAAIVNLAHTLGMVAVGEGVETVAQLGALRALGCDLAQGYHFGPPMSGAELTERLRAQADDRSTG